MTLTPVPGYDGPCNYCLVCMAHLRRESRVVRELRLCGIEPLAPMDAPPATHFAYPYTGAQSGNAVPVCDRHAELIRLDDDPDVGDALVEGECRQPLTPEEVGA